MADNASSRIKRSVQTLREWQWIATISTDLETVLLNLRKEAKALIALGLEHPNRAAEIGKIVVAYHRLMVAVKGAADRQSGRAAAPKAQIPEPRPSTSYPSF